MDITLILTPQLLILAITTYIVIELIKKIPLIKNWKYKPVFLTIMSVIIGACFSAFSIASMPEFIKESIVLTLCFGGIAGYFSKMIYDTSIKPLKEKVKLSEKKIEEIKESLPPPSK